MDLGLAGRRAAVAASTRGLGFATAQALLAEGAQVAVCGRAQDRVDAAVARLGDGAVGLVVDVSTEAGGAEFVAQAREALGGVDILVTNGGGPPAGHFGAIALEEYRAAMELNCLAAIAMCHAAVPAMRAAGWGRVLAITSVFVRRPSTNLILSSTARAGLTSFLRALAQEVAPDGVTVNTIEPGLHATERVHHLYGDGIDAEITRIPAARLGAPDDFGRVAAFLCSQPASFVTGVGLQVDGGTYGGLL